MINKKNFYRLDKNLTRRINMKDKKFLGILISILLGLGLVTYTKDPFLSIFIYICLVAVYKLIGALVLEAK